MITKNLIIKFVQEHFDENDYKVKSNGYEIQLNSPFKQDTKFHLGISLKEDNIGVWQDFKPPQDAGDFFKLVSLMKNISRTESKQFILENYMQYINISDIDMIPVKKKLEGNYEYSRIQLPKFCKPIDTNPKTQSYYVKGFINFLTKKRNIDIETIKNMNICYCYNGKYANCIVFPFYNDKKEIVYWVARNLIKKIYLNCPNDVAIGKGEGIGYNIFNNSETIVIVESILDALRLPESAVAILGSSISDKQIEFMLRNPRKEIIWVGDNYRIDMSGESGVAQGLDKIASCTGKKTKLFMFLWEKEFENYKDLSRCPFPITIESIKKYCEPYGEMHKLKMKILKDLGKKIWNKF